MKSAVLISNYTPWIFVYSVIISQNVSFDKHSKKRMVFIFQWVMARIGRNARSGTIENARAPRFGTSLLLLHVQLNQFIKLITVYRNNNDGIWWMWAHDTGCMGVDLRIKPQ